MDVDDMVMLNDVTEDDVVTNLKQRFEKDQIYTYISNVVVSVNPYKEVPLYSPDVIESYIGRGLYELSPHLFAIADDAYRSMRDLDLNQCVIISGESGAGKTEASKYLMQYVAAVSGKGVEIDRVKEQLLQSNPVLEAFGNAKTNRNDNSSRFGKYMDIAFDFKGDPVGGVITKYLLEKSRVTVQSAGEKNFHIFYQLLRTADGELKDSLRLNSDSEVYRYLQTGAESNDLTDDQALDNTRKAMEVIGFTNEEVTGALQLVASILIMGNLSFQPTINANKSDGCCVEDTSDLVDVCALLNCESELLKLALTKKTVEAIDDKVTIDLKVTEGVYARDALCKALYARLFAWLIDRINDSIKVSANTRRKCMGVLDIYGFEIFETNTFEQLIINFCNEKLQQLFIQLTLKEEQEEYMKENVPWEDVAYFDNSSIVDLIEKPPKGILTVLDEECLLPGDWTDLTFLYKLTSSCQANSQFQSRGCRKSQGDKTLPYDSFRIEHYAGVVSYNVAGFLDKNNDLLYRDLTRTMHRCEHSLLKVLFPNGLSTPEFEGGKGSLKRPPTTCAQLKLSLSELMTNLKSKNPNYIRCIKPNDEKREGFFVDDRVRHQVRYLGLVENIRVRRAGYAFRQIYNKFIKRYKMLSPQTWPTWTGEGPGGAQAILTDIGLSDDQFCCGNSKIFIRSPATVFDLERRRGEALHRLATTIQSCYRGWRMRRLYQTMKKAQILISAVYRGHRMRQLYLRKRRAAIKLQSYARGWKVRKDYRHLFKKHAGPILARTMITAMYRQYLMKLRGKLPTLSPTDDFWPPCIGRYKEASECLKQMYHSNRCRHYRNTINDDLKKLLQLKVIARDVFKDKKLIYSQSVTDAFTGDYAQIVDDVKWQKISTTMEEPGVIFADLITKINRKNGKSVSVLLVATEKTLYVLHPQTKAMKYKIGTAQITAISMSALYDQLILFNFTQDNGNLLSKKGDYLIECAHSIELVAKLYKIVQTIKSEPPQITIASKLKAIFHGKQLEIYFKPGNDQLNLSPGSYKVVRKSDHVDILEP